MHNTLGEANTGKPTSFTTMLPTSRATTFPTEPEVTSKTTIPTKPSETTTTTVTTITTAARPTPAAVVYHMETTTKFDGHIALVAHR